MRRLHLVLGTHNGERFLREQLASIRSQTLSDWTLLVRDDGSRDSSRQILTDAAGSDPRIEIFEDRLGRLGPAGTFAVLLDEARRRGASHVFLADQDDVWLPHKLERQLRLLEEAEMSNPGEPMLVHSDLRVVGADLRPIHRSFLAFQCLRHVRRDPLATLCVQNFVTGCTIGVNRALLEVALPLPSQAVMHDWWLALCAAASGQVLFLPEATVLYRQHGENVVGAAGYWRSVFGFARRIGLLGKQGSPEFRRTVLQMRAARSLRARIKPQALKFLDRYCGLFDEPLAGWERVGGLRRLGVGRQDVLRNLLLHGRLLLTPAKPLL